MLVNELVGPGMVWGAGFAQHHQQSDLARRFPLPDTRQLRHRDHRIAVRGGEPAWWKTTCRGSSRSGWRAGNRSWRRACPIWTPVCCRAPWRRWPTTGRPSRPTRSAGRRSASRRPTCRDRSTSPPSSGAARSSPPFRTSRSSSGSARAAGGYLRRASRAGRPGLHAGGRRRMHLPALHHLSGADCLVKDDSSIMLSPRTYARFIRPANERVLEALGGGGIHWCGSGQHWRAEFVDTAGLTCIDWGNPERLDLAAWEPLPAGTPAAGRADGLAGPKPSWPSAPTACSRRGRPSR